MRRADHRLSSRQPGLAGTGRAVRRAVALAAGLLALGAAPASADHSADHCQDIVGADTFLVGDSHTWLSGCGVAYPSWDVDALPGRASTDGLSVTTSSLRARHRRVVFDLATNDRGDPAALAANLRALWDVVGPDRSLLLVSSYTAPRDTGPVNTVLRDFVATHPRRSDVAPWARYVREHPEVLSADGVHFTTAGYSARVAIVKAALHDLPTLRARRGETHAAAARPVGAKAPAGAGRSEARPMKRKPVALLFHGGGFVAGEASIPDAEAAARAQGFKPVSVDYELGNLRQAWRDASRAAGAYGPERQVVAYGESAGGALAARLAQKGRVSTATAYMPPTDLSNVANPTLTAMIQSLGASPMMIRRMSVARHRTRNPVLAQVARDDVLIAPAQTQAWAKGDPLVRAQMVEGTHIYPTTPDQRAPRSSPGPRAVSRAKTDTSAPLQGSRWPRTQGTPPPAAEERVGRSLPTAKPEGRWEGRCRHTIGPAEADQRGRTFVMRKVICVAAVLGLAVVSAAPAQATTRDINSTIKLAHVVNTGSPPISGSAEYAGTFKGALGSGAVVGRAFVRRAQLSGHVPRLPEQGHVQGHH